MACTRSARLCAGSCARHVSPRTAPMWTGFYSSHCTGPRRHLLLAACILQRAPCSPLLAACSMQLAASSLQLAACRLRLAAYCLRLAACCLHLSAGGLQLAACSVQRAARGLQLAAGSVQLALAACCLQLIFAARSPQLAACILHACCLQLSACELAACSVGLAAGAGSLQLQLAACCVSRLAACCLQLAGRHLLTPSLGVLRSNRCLHFHSVWFHIDSGTEAFRGKRILVIQQVFNQCLNFALTLASHGHWKLSWLSYLVVIGMTLSMGVLRATRCRHCRPL